VIAYLIHQFNCFRLQKKVKDGPFRLYIFFFSLFFLFAVMLDTKRENVLLFATVSVVLAVGVFVFWGPTFRQKRRSKLDTYHFKKKVNIVSHTH
jgi:hypothetical protein